MLFPHNNSAIAQIPPDREEELLRLAEILGGIQFLHSLCSKQETTFWSDTLSELIDSEITDSSRRRKFIEQYNLGFQGYAATHRTCTPNAKQALDEYVAEGLAITDALLRQQ